MMGTSNSIVRMLWRHHRLYCRVRTPVSTLGRLHCRKECRIVKIVSAYCIGSVKQCSIAHPLIITNIKNLLYRSSEGLDIRKMITVCIEIIAIPVLVDLFDDLPITSEILGECHKVTSLYEHGFTVLGNDFH